MTELWAAIRRFEVLVQAQVVFDAEMCARRAARDSALEALEDDQNRNIRHLQEAIGFLELLNSAEAMGRRLNGEAVRSCREQEWSPLRFVEMLPEDLQLDRLTIRTLYDDALDRSGICEKGADWLRFEMEMVLREHYVDVRDGFESRYNNDYVRMMTVTQRMVDSELITAVFDDGVGDVDEQVRRYEEEYAILMREVARLELESDRLAFEARRMEAQNVAALQLAKMDASTTLQAAAIAAAGQREAAVEAAVKMAEGVVASAQISADAVIASSQINADAATASAQITAGGMTDVARVNAEAAESVAHIQGGYQLGAAAIRTLGGIWSAGGGAAAAAGGAGAGGAAPE